MLNPTKFVERDNGYKTSCWEWSGYINKKGYGEIYLGRNKQSALAHRFFYKLDKGEIPPGLQLDHLCRVRHCCNPNHLEPVTNAVNTRRGLLPKLTIEQVVGIKNKLISGMAYIAIAHEYGISIRTVSAIKSGYRWKDI